MKAYFLLPLFAIIGLTACKKEQARVTFRNNSVTNKVYNVVWDGSVICTLYPHSSSEEFEEEPGRHSLVFKVSNTGANACSPSDPTLSEGDSEEFSCSQ